MEKKCGIKKYIQIIPEEKEVCLIYGGENEMLRLKGKSVKDFLTLLPYLNGKYTTEEISKKTKLEKKVVINVISLLKKYNLIEEEDIPSQLESEIEKYEDQLIYFSHGPKSKFYPQIKLMNSRIGLLPYPNRLTREVKNILTTSGIGIIYEWKEEMIFSLKETSQIDLLVVGLEKFNPRLLKDINKFCIQHSLPWLIIQAPYSAEGIVGPLFIPGETACYECLKMRIKSNIFFYAEFEEFEKWVEKNKEKVKKFGALEPFWHILASIGALEIVKFISEVHTSQLIGKILTVNFITLEVELHDVLKLPFCATCRKEKLNYSPWLEPVERK
jgi:bacteriocin biosynthesis cyclodehydratase domain-containing protein